MEISELKTKNAPELKALLQEKKEKMRQLKFDLASGKVKNVKEIREIRKDIARIMTIMSNSKLQISK